MPSELLDALFTGLAFAVPVVLVVTFRARGILYGAAWHWMTLIIAGKYLDLVDSQRDGAMLDGIWFLFGWVWALAYCAVIYGVVWLFARRRG